MEKLTWYQVCLSYLAIVDAVFVESNGGTGEDRLPHPLHPSDGRDARCQESPGDGLSCNINNSQEWRLETADMNVCQKREYWPRNTVISSTRDDTK